MPTVLPGLGRFSLLPQPADADTWLRSVSINVCVPAVCLAADNRFGSSGRISWCDNLAHNVIREAYLGADGTVIEIATPRTLDMETAHHDFPPGGRSSYDDMIGNRPELRGQVQLPATTVTLPLPTCFSRAGAAIPVGVVGDMWLQLNAQPPLSLLVLENADTGERTRPLEAEVTGLAEMEFTVSGEVERHPDGTVDRTVEGDRTVDGDLIVDVFVELEAIEVDAGATEVTSQVSPGFPALTRGFFFALWDPTRPSVYDDQTIKGVDLAYNGQAKVVASDSYTGFIDAFYHAGACPPGIHFHSVTHAQLSDRRCAGSVNLWRIDNTDIRVTMDPVDHPARLTVVLSCRRLLSTRGGVIEWRRH